MPAHSMRNNNRILHGDQTGGSYRQDAAKRQSAGIKFTHRPKIRFFAPQRRLVAVAPIHVKFVRTDGQVAPLGCAEFHLNRLRGGNVAPKISKISTFW